MAFLSDDFLKPIFTYFSEVPFIVLAEMEKFYTRRGINDFVSNCVLTTYFYCYALNVKSLLLWKTTQILFPLEP